jgi:DNA/RNA endonuclease YhcR with UshA esterase domain
MFVKRQRAGIALLTMLATVLLASTCFAAEGETVQLQGVVSVTRDANDVITAVQLVADAGTYNVELDANGQELGESMEGESVEVEGVVSEKDGQKWLTVSTFSTLEE